MISIISCNRTSETADRLREQLADLQLDLTINLGNSSYDDSSIDDSKIINRTEAVKKCVDKKLMFENLIKGNVKTLAYYDITRLRDRLRTILKFNDLVLRDENRLKIVKWYRLFSHYKAYSYATGLESKIYEYRVLLYRHKPFRVMVKVNNGNDFVLKQHNSVFIDITPYRANNDVLDEAIKSSKALGIDLASVDLLVNKDNEIKVIECNSGSRLCLKSIGLLKERLVREQRDIEETRQALNEQDIRRGITQNE